MPEGKTCTKHDLVVAAYGIDFSDDVYLFERYCVNCGARPVRFLKRRAVPVAWGRPL